MRERLDPCSKVMAGQDFRRTTQRDGEPVSDFICWLEKVYSIVYGTEKMSKDTKDVMLRIWTTSRRFEAVNCKESQCIRCSLIQRALYGSQTRGEMTG